jgi:hypothetical protein
MCATRLLRISAANIGPKPVPPEPHGLVADVDPTLGHEIFDVAQRQWVSHVHHHHQTDDLRRAVEISERIAHAPRLTQPRTAREFALTPPLNGLRLVLGVDRLDYSKGIIQRISAFDRFSRSQSRVVIAGHLTADHAKESVRHHGLPRNRK